MNTGLGQFGVDVSDFCLKVNQSKDESFGEYLYKFPIKINLYDDLSVDFKISLPFTSFFLKSLKDVSGSHISNLKKFTIGGTHYVPNKSSSDFNGSLNSNKSLGLANFIYLNNDFLFYTKNKKVVSNKNSSFISFKENSNLNLNTNILNDEYKKMNLIHLLDVFKVAKIKSEELNIDLRIMFRMVLGTLVSMDFYIVY